MNVEQLGYLVIFDVPGILYMSDKTGIPKSKPTECTVDLPVDVKERLLQLAEHLPEKARSGFLKRAAQQLGELALQYPNMIVFTIVGWTIGEILDNLLSIPVPFSDMVFELTGDHLSDLGGAGGALYGFLEDKQRNALRSQVSDIVSKELRRALASV